MFIIKNKKQRILDSYLFTYMLQAKKTGDEVDQQRFLQQQSDVCMLRLFDSFGESAPQLVFHLYVLIKKNGMENSETWTWDQATWTILSAMTSLVSLGWGIAAYR